MNYRRLERSGLKVSELCLGTMQFGWTADEATSQKVLSAAFEAGVNFFDTADVYSRWVEGNEGGVAERILGQWIRDAQVPRQEIVIATKVRAAMGPGPNQEGLSRKHVLDAAEASLRRLGTDYIDLYQLHSPDDETPIEETLSALNDLVRAGKVLYLGCSNFTAWRLLEALWMADRHGYSSFVSLQPHFNLVHAHEYRGELEQVCRRYQLGVLPYSPLAGGFLTDKYQRGQPPPAGSRGEKSARVLGYMQEEKNWRLHETLAELAQQRGKSVSQLALGWLLSQPTVTSPIIGPRNLRQLEDNLGAAGLRLEAGELEAVEGAREADGEG